MMKPLTCIVAVLMLLCSSLHNAQADFLNDYFFDKTFGANPGPCPNFANKCTTILDVNRLSPSVQNIVVCLVRDYCYATFPGWLGGGCTHPRITLCAKIKEWVKGGKLDFWNLQCSRFGLSNLNLFRESKTTTQVVARGQSSGIKQRCTGSLYMTDVKLSYGALTVILSGESLFSTSDGVTSNFDFKMRFTATPNFNTNLPSDLVIPIADCIINIGTGLTLDILNNNRFDKAIVELEVLGLVLRFSISFLPLEGLTNLLVAVIEAAFGGIICDILSQGAKQLNGQDGFLNEKLDDFLEWFNEISTGSPDNLADFDSNPRSKFPYLSLAEVNKAVDFATSDFLELLSITLNNWLGREDPPGRLIINDAIEQLLDSPTAEFTYDLVAENVLLNTTIPINVADIFIKLERFDAEHLNTITTFKLLENNFQEGTTPADRFHFTLKHELDMSTIEFLVNIRVTFFRGAWVTKSNCGNINPFRPGGTGHPDTLQCTSDSKTFNFQYGMTWDNVKLSAATLTVVDPKQLDEVQLGQIFGRNFRNDPTGAAKNIARCLSPALYAAYLPSLSLSIGTIRSPPVAIIPTQTGLATLISNVVVLVNDMTNSVFRSRAPGIMQGTVRPAINEFLEKEVVLPASLANCPPYVPGLIPPADLYFNFEDGLVANIYPVINNVLGDFSTDTKTDINDVLQIFLEYYSDQIETFPLEPSSEQGDWRTKEFLRTLAYLPAFEPAFSGDAFINVSNFQIFNLNSIYEVNAEPFGTTKNGFKLDFGFGKILGSPAVLELTTDWKVKVDDFSPPIDEFFTVTLRLKEIDMSVALDHVLINRDHVYQLRFRQLQSTPCLLSVLDGLTVASSLLLADEVFIVVDTQYAVGSNPAGLHPFAEAVFRLEESTTGLVSPQFKAMVNTILNNGFANILDQMENFDFSMTPANCDNADDPLGELFALFTGFKLPDVTETVATCIAEPTEPKLTPAQAEAQIIGLNDSVSYFDFTDSFIVKTLQDQFGTNEDDADRNEVLREIIFLLANRSGTPLTDAFFLEDIDDGEGGTVTVVSFFLALAQSNFLFDLFDIEPLIFENGDVIPDARFELTNLTVRGIDRFVTNTKLLETKSRFVTGYSFGFTEDNPLVVDLHGKFEANAVFIGGNSANKVVEDFHLNVIVEGFELDFELLAAINTDIFVNLSLGHFFEVTPGELDFIFAETMMECLFSTFFQNGISIPRLNMSVSQLQGPTLRTSKNIVSQEFEDVLDEATRLLTAFYIDAIPNIAFNCIRGFINDELRKRWLAGQGGACPKKPQNTDLPVEDQIFRFGTSKGIQRFNNFIFENFIVNDYELWNDIMFALTRAGGQPVVLFDEDPLGPEDLTITYKGAKVGELTMLIKDLKIIGLNTFTNLQIIEPVDYDNYTTIDAFKIDGPTTFDFNLDIIAKDMFEDYPVLRNNLAIKLTLENITFGLELYVLMNVTEALTTRFSSVSSFNEIPCLLVPLDALIPKDFNLSTTSIDVEIQCAGECDFPLFSHLENGGTIKSDNDGDISKLLNDAIEFLVDYTEGSGAQRLIDAQIKTAEETCDQILGLITGVLGNIERTDDFDVATFMGYGFLAFMGVTGLASLFLFPLHKKRRKQALQSFLKERKTLTQEKEVQMFQTSLKSLFQHPATPVFMKFLVPLVCILNVFGLVISVVFSGAINIVITFTLFGAETNQIVLVPFTIVSTINDTWNSGAYFLAAIIGLASCAWPVIKNVFLMLIWFSPTTILNKNRRNKYLLILDVLGKWSFLDVFVVVMTLAALRTYLQLSMYSRLQYLPEDSLAVNVTVTPERGIVLLCLIASTSLIINHVISWYHEKAARADQKEEDILRGVLLTIPPRAAKKMAVWNHAFAGIDKKGRRKVVSVKALKTLTVINIFSGLAVMVGISVKFVTFNLGGLIGLLISQISEPLAVKTYSIVDLGAVVNQAPQKTSLEVFVIVFFQILFFATSAVFPFLQMVVNQGLLMIPLSLRDQKMYLWLAYLVSFWAALECFLLGIILTLVNIDQITVYILDFISDDFCSNVQGILETLLGPQNGSCLSVAGNLEPLAPILFIGVLLQLAVSITVLQVGEAVTNDRYYQSYNGVRRDTRPPKQSWLKKQVLRIMTAPASNRIKKGRAAAVEEPEDNTNSIALQSIRAPPVSGPESRESVASNNPLFRQDSSPPGTPPAPGTPSLSTFYRNSANEDVDV